MKTWLHDVFRRHAREIDRFLRNRGHSPETAADLTQDAFLRVMTATEDRAIENPRAYLHHVARNLSIDTARREGRLRRTEVHDGDSAAVADLAPDSERIVADRQLLAIAEAALAELPERTRYAFEAHRMGERTIAEIAGELGLSTTRTWTLIRNAYLHLRIRVDAGKE